MTFVKEAVADELGVDIDEASAEYTAQDFHCRCASTDHVSKLIKHLPASEILEILNEENTKKVGGVALVCEMCNRQNVIKTEDILSRLP